MNRAFVMPLILIALTLVGCASTMSGVGGASGYACQAPAGALCTSVSGIYANSTLGLPKPAKPPEERSAPAAPVVYGASSIAPGSTAAVSGSSIRSNPRLLRLWIAPWEDADGDLHEEAVVHLVVDTGRWLIEHVRPASRSRVEEVAPPISPAQETTPEKSAAEAPQIPTRFPLPPAATSPGPEPAPMEP
ncbi:MAG: type IV conjugative transfer system lipoprotein TraV [Burkholderiales bacterium]|nr:type IV conjugative transfer system lipoprotein TraV [Burkholderiales bacterium]